MALTLNSPLSSPHTPSDPRFLSSHSSTPPGIPGSPIEVARTFFAGKTQSFTIGSSIPKSPRKPVSRTSTTSTSAKTQAAIKRNIEVFERESKRLTKENEIAPALFSIPRLTAEVIFPSPRLFTAVEEPYLEINKAGGFFDIGKIPVIEIGAGKHHKCFLVEWKGKQFAVKTFQGNGNPDEKLAIYTRTLKAYKLLKERSDVSVATMYKKKQVPVVGFYVYDYIDAQLPKFDSIIKSFIAEIIRDQSKAIEDFRPDNVRIVKEEIVIIDPSLLDDNFSQPIYLTCILPEWCKLNGRVDRFLLRQMINDFNKMFDSAPLDSKHQQAWDRTQTILTDTYLQTRSRLSKING